MVIQQTMVAWAHVLVRHENRGEAATTPPQPPLATSPAVKQTSLPDLLAHGQQRQGGREFGQAHQQSVAAKQGAEKTARETRWWGAGVGMIPLVVRRTTAPGRSDPQPTSR